VVHGRENKGGIDEFGVSGYVYKDVFIIYDRRTESLWYPLDDEKWTAISGPRKGESISFIANRRSYPSANGVRNTPKRWCFSARVRPLKRRRSRLRTTRNRSRSFHYTGSAVA